MWNLLPSERLRCWQTFRQSISQKTLEQATKDTQHLWSYAPFVSRYLIALRLDEWPNPWELIYENQYCDLAKALAIVYTLYLSEHRPDMEIRIYKDAITGEMYNLVFVDGGKYVLNYVHDEVVNKEQVDADLILERTISSRDLGLAQLQ